MDARRRKGKRVSHMTEPFSANHQDHATAARTAQPVRNAAWVVGLSVLLASCATAKRHGHDHSTEMDHTVEINARDSQAHISGPHDLDGLLATGWTLMKQGEFDESIAWIQEGLTNNPGSFQLHYLLGQVHFNRARQSAIGALSLDQVNIAPMLQSARAAYAQAVQLGFSARQAADTSVWTNYLETDLRAAIRMDAMMEHRFGSQKIAIRKARHALTILETDPVLEKILAKWQSP